MICCPCSSQNSGRKGLIQLFMVPGMMVGTSILGTPEEVLGLGDQDPE